MQCCEIGLHLPERRIDPALWRTSLSPLEPLTQDIQNPYGLCGRLWLTDVRSLETAKRGEERLVYTVSSAGVKRWWLWQSQHCDAWLTYRGFSSTYSCFGGRRRERRRCCIPLAIMYLIFYITLICQSFSLGWYVKKSCVSFNTNSFTGISFLGKAKI